MSGNLSGRPGNAAPIIRKPIASLAALASLTAIAFLIATSVATASGPIVPPGHKSQQTPKPPRDHKPRDDKPKHHGRHHKWHRHFLETSLRETGWICVKAYRDRHGFWRCTAWAMQ
jgi:hypothetical protein